MSGGTTFFKLFNSRNCGYSTYKLKYRSYRILRRIERNRRENSARKATSDCGFFSHEFPSYNEAKLFLTPPINVFDDHSGYIRTGSTPSAHNGGQLELATSARLRDMTILREPRSHVISGIRAVSIDLAD